ncbi:MAG: hypothetical protein HXY38_15945, partial [Chloroflexi bacterium]|nr:hypothetical protein [Chloroflexota bacterium]
ITAIREATIELGLLEDNPPVIPETPKTPPKTETKPKPASKKAVPTPPVEGEPTIDIPLRKGTKTVRISHLKLVGGETDAAAYKQAVLIAAKLIDGGLWDGASPIRIDDVYATMRKMKHLTDSEMGLFSLEDFVSLGDATPQPENGSDEDAEIALEPALANGSYSETQSDQPGLM